LAPAKARFACVFVMVAIAGGVLVAGFTGRCSGARRWLGLHVVPPKV